MKGAMKDVMKGGGWHSGGAGRPADLLVFTAPSSYQHCRTSFSTDDVLLLESLVCTYSTRDFVHNTTYSSGVKCLAYEACICLQL